MKWVLASSREEEERARWQQAACTHEHASAAQTHASTHPRLLMLPPPCSLSFHIHFYRMLKWLIAGPFVAAAVALLAYQPDPDALP